MRIKTISNIYYVDIFSQLLFQILQSNIPLKIENSVRTKQHFIHMSKIGYSTSNVGSC